MSNQERPEGWTERMQPLPNENVPTPEFGGHGGQRMAPQATQDPAHGQAPTQTEDAPQGGAQGDPTEGMGSGERYWYDQAMQARENFQKVAPLAPYVDVITYLDANPAATQLVMEHMRGETPGNVPPENANPSPADQHGATTPNMGSNNTYQDQRNTGAGNSVSPDMASQLKAQHMEMLKTQGVPAHEADKYVQWLMNPGSLEPDDLFHMYKSLREKNNEPVGQNNVPNQEQTPQSGQSQTPPATAGNQPEMPPMSVAGMNGGTTDPHSESEINRRARVRNVLDPNNV